MKKGIVMEIDEPFLLLLTPEGEFLRAKKQNQPYSIGEELYFFPIENEKTRPSLKSIKHLLKMKPVWVAAIAIIIFFGTFIPSYQNNKAYAYMSIDVNPSIELGVNKNMQVVELKGFNNDGKKVISKINHWQKKDVSDLTKTILGEMKKEGYLKNHQQVILTTVRVNQKEKSAEEKLNENIKKIKETATKEHLAVKVQNGTEKDREKASQLGITTGKYQENKNQSAKKNDNPQTNIPAATKENDSKLKAPLKKNDGSQGQGKNVNKSNSKKLQEIKKKPVQNGHQKEYHSAPGQLKKLQKKLNSSKKEELIQKKHRNGHPHKFLEINQDVYFWKSLKDNKDLEKWTNLKHHQVSDSWDKLDPKNKSKEHHPDKH